MKKTLLMSVAALVMVVSGVAAVSAYEAHIVNVSAHVENALGVSGPTATQGGEWLGATVFPEEWLTANITISLSDSFKLQSRVTMVDYELYAERKSEGDPPPLWLGDAMYLIVDPPAGWDATTAGAAVIGDDPGAIPNVVGPIVSGNLTTGSDPDDYLGVGLDVPVFAGFYNSATDPKPKPSGLMAPTLIILDADPRHEPVTGFDGGVDLKIQVVDIY